MRYVRFINSPDRPLHLSEDKKFIFAPQDAMPLIDNWNNRGKNGPIPWQYALVAIECGDDVWREYQELEKKYSF